MLWKVRYFGHGGQFNCSWLFADSYGPRHNFSDLRSNFGINLRVSTNSQNHLNILSSSRSVWFGSCLTSILVPNSFSPRRSVITGGLVASISWKELDNHHWGKRRKGVSLYPLSDQYHWLSLQREKALVLLSLVYLYFHSHHHPNSSTPTLFAISWWKKPIYSHVTGFLKNTLKMQKKLKWCYEVSIRIVFWFGCDDRCTTINVIKFIE